MESFDRVTDFTGSLADRDKRRQDWLKVSSTGLTYWLQLANEQRVRLINPFFNGKKVAMFTLFIVQNILKKRAER